METQKRSKKVLKNLINDSMLEAISSLKLPEPSRKVKKLLDRSSKKLASAFSEMMKKEEKKKKKAEKLLKAAVNGDGKKKRKQGQKQKEKQKQKPESIRREEPVKI